MRRYHTVFGTLLILSIIDFALAAPVLVQEKRQAYTDGVPILVPKDVTTASRRADLAELAAEYLKTWGKPIESSDAHASPSPASSTDNPDASCLSLQGLQARGNCFRKSRPSSGSGSAQPVPDHGPTNAVEAPTPGALPSADNPDSLEELPSPALEELPRPALEEPPSPVLAEPSSPAWDPNRFVPPWSEDDSIGYSSDEGYVKLPKMKPKPVDPWQSVDPNPNPNPAPKPAFSTANPNPSMEPQSPQWVQTPEFNNFIPPWSDELSMGTGSDSGYISQPLSKPKSNPRPSTDPNFNSGSDLMAADQPPPSLSPAEFDKDNNVHPPSPDAPPPTKIYSFSHPGSPSPDSLPLTKIYSSSYPGSVVHSPSTGLVPPEGLALPGLGTSNVLDDGVPPPPTKIYSSSYPGSVVHSPPTGLVSPEGLASPGLGTPKVLEDGGPPPNPEWTDPGNQLDHKLLMSNAAQSLGRVF